MNVTVTSRPNAVRMKPGYDLCISIRDAHDPGFYSKINLDAALKHRASEVVALYFDDVTPKSEYIIDPRYESYTAFNQDHAKIILEVVKDKANILIHCEAGMSRSVAVGAFLRDFFDADAVFRETRHDSFKNIHVYNVLRRVFLNKPIEG